MFGFNRSATVHTAWLGEKVKSKRAGKQKTSRFFKLFHVKHRKIYIIVLKKRKNNAFTRKKTLSPAYPN